MSRKPDVRKGDRHKKHQRNTDYRATKKASQDEDTREYEEIKRKVKETLEQNTMLNMESNRLQDKIKTLQRDLKESQKVVDIWRVFCEHRGHVKSQPVL